TGASSVFDITATASVSADQFSSLTIADARLNNAANSFSAGFLSIQSATIAGGQIDVQNGMQWTGGTLSGGASVTVDGTSSITGSGGKFLDNATLTFNSDTITIQTPGAGNDLMLSNGAILNIGSGAWMNLQDDDSDILGSDGTVVVSGVLDKQSGAP